METVEIKPVIAPELLDESLISEERQVIVHCLFPRSPESGNLIRIWKSTFLIDRFSGHESELVHAENITYFPLWTEIPPMKDYWFTLVFTGLPSDCKFFDLKEIIPQEGGFHIPNIRRNKTDVYKVRVG